MRSGRLLAEDSPENLLRDYNQTSLENVFLELCMKNDENKLTSIVTNDTSCNQTDYKNEQTQQSQGGVDNMVFDESALSNVTETDIAIQLQNHNNCDVISPNDSFVVTQLLSIYSFLAFYSLCISNDLF
jgi:hypothetical protein